MINNVSPSAGASPAATEAAAPAASTRVVYHTPFGDVMVDTMGSPDTPGAGRPAIAPIVVHAATPKEADPTAMPAPPPTPTIESEFGHARENRKSLPALSLITCSLPEPEPMSKLR